MLIVVGSANPIKVSAVEQAIHEYEGLKLAKVQAMEVNSGVSDQPLSLKEIIQGAKNRAQLAFQSVQNCTYSVGIESGLFEAPGTTTGYLEACISVVYDGQFYHTGMSCGFEVPPPVLKGVIEDKLNLSDACYSAKVTANKKLGSAEGIIGIVTGGRINRQAYTRQSLITALAQLDHPDWYKVKK